MAVDPAHIPPPTDEDLERVRALAFRVGGRGVTWGAQSLLDVLAAEHRLRADLEANKGLTRATWMLAAATLVLAFATVGLLVATLAH